MSHQHLTLDSLHRAREHIQRTLAPSPVIDDIELSRQLGCPVRLKAELFQPTGSFKPRGSLNWLATASDAELAAGLGAVSAGNHALGLAWAASERGVPVTIVMPENASPYKVEGSRALGAEVILHGDINDAWTHMHQLVASRGLTLVHPYDDPRIIAGQGSVGLEILEQIPHAAMLLCPIGGGGLIAGIAVAVKALRPDIRLIGVEPTGAASMQAAFDYGGPCRLGSVETLAKSLGAAIVGEHTYPLVRRCVDALIGVSESAIDAAMRHLLFDAKLLAEPGAAVGIAALLEGQLALPQAGDIVVVVTGGNLGGDELSRWC
ncbi:threonine/serine dehydratase [Halomonas sp. HP20-15]|uniref:threonine ammonia-lyase n=1 Tax=Halomonas sp. HP20-15 TaxID=3085901 RepID=UPI0029828C25|nr:threonine/serine dehydratase [Halomonas sp. HP20-15]MDW5377861.1 threonine/serine dehydratase [Halomonas sp. HP20-15]